MKNEFKKFIAQSYWQKVIGLILLLSASYTGYPVFFNVQSAYLSTDLLIYLLVCCAIFFIAYIRKQPHLSEPWKQVFKNKIAMSSAVVLSFFIIIGLMDSVHYRQADSASSNIKEQASYSTEMLSLLDSSLNYISKNQERTYSAPFSIYSYAKENFTNSNGVKYRAYPRLIYAGSHLEQSNEKYMMDVVTKSIKGLSIGLGVSSLLIVIVLFFIKKNNNESYRSVFLRILNGHYELPWKVMLFTLMFIITFIVWLLYMSNFYHVMGTDKVGQDVFYLTLKSIRTGLVIGTLTTIIMLPFAIALGIMAGYFKGVVDDIIQYVYTTLTSIPGILLIVAVMLAIDVYIENHVELFETAIQRADLKLLALCVVLGITSWTGLCRLLRGEVFKLRELEYIQAARALGVSDFKIILSHIIPNVMHIVLIVVVLDFSGLVLAEAVLAYIGVGVDPSTISWGNMINSARLELAREPVVWWSLMAAFSFMFALVLAANLFSDAIRDAFDPRSQGIKS